MEIRKKLKYADFVWNEDKKELDITTWVESGVEVPPVLPETIKLNKTYLFALSRFITRLSQRYWLRRKK